jgi:hypothetical protein
MDIKEAIKERHSVRQYTEAPIEGEIRNSLEMLISKCNEESGLNIQLICDDKECFDVFLAHYGKFSNATNYIALVGKAAPDLEEKAGYFGQKIVLVAQTMGLNTCWVAGTYGKNKCKAKIGTGEKLACIISIGYGKNKGAEHRSKPVSKLCKVSESSMPEWFKKGVEAALLAPTAMNQQKFIIDLDGDTPVITARMGPYSKIDLGIVKFNFEAATGIKCK